MDELATIQNLVGRVTREDLRYVDCFVCPEMGIFIPAVGPCFYAVAPDHAHPAYSFILAFDDCSEISAGGKILNPYPGKVMAIDPGAIHHEVPRESPRYIAIFIVRSFFELQRSIYKGIKPEPFNYCCFSPGPELIPILKDFMNEYEAALPGKEPILKALALRITHSLIRAAYRISGDAGNISGRIEIHQAIEFLHTHYQEKVTLERMAAVAAMSPSHFTRIFRQETGHSPLEYLICLRLQKAKKLLRTGEGSITSVAHQCGFSSSSHFASCFQKHHGQSPSQFIKSLSQQNCGKK